MYKVVPFPYSYPLSFEGTRVDEFQDLLNEHLEEGWTLVQVVTNERGHALAGIFSKIKSPWTAVSDEMPPAHLEVLLDVGNATLMANWEPIIGTWNFTDMHSWHHAAAQASPSDEWHWMRITKAT